MQFAALVFIYETISQYPLHIFPHLNTNLLYRVKNYTCISIFVPINNCHTIVSLSNIICSEALFCQLILTKSRKSSEKYAKISSWGNSNDKIRCQIYINFVIVVLNQLIFVNVWALYKNEKVHIYVRIHKAWTHS